MAKPFYYTKYEEILNLRILFLMIQCSIKMWQLLYSNSGCYGNFKVFIPRDNNVYIYHPPVSGRTLNFIVILERFHILYFRRDFRL